MNHTREPWKWDFDTRGTPTETGSSEFLIWSGYDEADPTYAASADREEDAERIVACVNACEGLDPKLINPLIRAAEQVIMTAPDSGNAEKQLRDVLRRIKV